MPAEHGINTRAILETIADGVVVADPEGRVRLINPAAATLLGVDPMEVLGESIGDLPGGETIKEALTDEVGQLSINARFLRYHVRQAYDERGDWVGTLISLRDVTYEVHVEQRMHALLSLLINQTARPLTPILGYADILLSGAVGTLTEEQRKCVSAIKSNSSDMVQLVENLVDISRLDTEHVALERENVNVGRLATEVVEELRSQFTERSIILNLEVQRGLPLVYADPARLRQVLTSLLDNARKYTPRGGQVDVRVWNFTGQVRVDVEDTGVGIAQAWHHRIFTPFFRAYNPHLVVDKTNYSGWGLSLAIVKGLIDLHGGRIWFESLEGQGTNFCFTLPVEEAR